MYVEGIYFETTEDAARFLLGDEMTDELIATGELITAPDDRLLFLPAATERLIESGELEVIQAPGFNESGEWLQFSKEKDQEAVHLRKLATTAAVADAIVACRAYGRIPLLDDENAGPDVAVDIEVWG